MKRKSLGKRLAGYRLPISTSGLASICTIAITGGFISGMLLTAPLLMTINFQQEAIDNLGLADQIEEEMKSLDDYADQKAWATITLSVLGVLSVITFATAILSVAAIAQRVESRKRRKKERLKRKKMLERALDKWAAAKYKAAEKEYALLKARGIRDALEEALEDDKK